MNNDYEMWPIWSWLARLGIHCTYSCKTSDIIRLDKLDTTLTFNTSWQLEIFLKRIYYKNGDFVSMLAERL